MHPGHRALRRGRFSESGRLYVVTTVTHSRRRLFTDLFTGRLVVMEMRGLVEEGLVESYAWVLMPEHLHWLIGLGYKRDLSDVMRLLKGRSAFRINQRLKKRGAIWQRAFYDHALRRDEDMRQVARYIVANPLRAGIVKSIKEYPLWDALWL